MTAGESAKAEPTKDEATALLGVSVAYITTELSTAERLLEGCTKGSTGRAFYVEQIRIFRFILSVLEAPPAAERTALKELREKVEKMVEKDEAPIYMGDMEWSAGSKGQSKFRRVLDLIDAASASEGTKSE